MGGDRRRKRRRGKTKNAKRVARALRMPKNVIQPGIPATTPELLQRAAAMLNMIENDGQRVRLAHGALITDHGYVFWINGRWQARTLQLTEFPDNVDDDLQRHLLDRHIRPVANDGGIVNRAANDMDHRARDRVHELNVRLVAKSRAAEHHPGHKWAPVLDRIGRQLMRAAARQRQLDNVTVRTSRPLVIAQ